MFIRNPSSINRKIIHCTQKEYEFLISNGYLPLSKDENGWIFLDSDEIRKYINRYKEGG